MVNRHHNVSVDLAAMPVDAAEKFPHPTAVAFLRRLIEGVGAHKVMFGTDWPYFGRGKPSWRELWGLIAEGCAFLSDEQSELILWRNALRFVGAA